MATWETGYRRADSMRPYPDEEIVCVTMNWWSPPSVITMRRVTGMPGGPISDRKAGQSSALDTALCAVGAVFPSLPDEDEAEVVAHYEEHGGRLSTAVFTAIGNY
ncbi:hypothetical protein [Streptomyces sp. NPDC002540]